MKPKQIMLIAGEASGDLLAAGLVGALRTELTAAETEYSTDMQPLRTGLEPRFFGLGGRHMKAAGVELAFDLTEHSIIGIPSLRSYLKSRRQFHQALQLAIERQPDAIIGVDYNYFNLKFAQAIRHYLRSRQDWFHQWRPKIVKFISPQVWASRENRAYDIARDYDLLLSIFPFEKEWYARRVPGLRVEFVGHPIFDRFTRPASSRGGGAMQPPRILLLPGSRKGELKRHLPAMLEALKIIQTKLPGATAKMVLPDDALAQMAKSAGVSIEIQIGNLPQALAQADLAISKTGTVTTECAFFGVPAVTLYKTSFLTYEFGKRVVKVKSLTMPNLLAGEEVYPEYIQGAATPENISRAVLELLQNENRRAEMKGKLEKVVASMGGPGASQKAARAIVDLIEEK